MDFKEKIASKGLKIIFVAKQIGISHGLLGKYMSGTRPMPEKIEKKLKEYLA